MPARFQLELTLPEPVTTGQHELAIFVPAQEHDAEASASLNILVSKLATRMVIETPRLAVLPGAIRVSGRVDGELGPVTGATVMLKIKDLTVMTRTSSDGSFTGTIRAAAFPSSAPLSSNPFYFVTPADSPPFDASLFGIQEITVAVQPREPWNSPLEIKKPAFILNPLVTGLMLALLLTLGLLVLRTGKTMRRPERHLPKAEARGQPALFPATPHQPRLTGLGGRILAAYRDGLEVAARITGAAMAPDITLREFMAMARLPSPAANSQFAELTLLAEGTLYSASLPQEGTAQRAEQLATAMREELNHGAA